MLKRRMDLKAQLGWGWFLLSKQQRAQAEITFELVAHWIKLLPTTQETQVILTQLEFWQHDLQRLENGKSPQHPVLVRSQNVFKNHRQAAQLLQQTLEAFTWIALQQPLQNDRDFTTYCSKLGSYWNIILTSEKHTALEQEQLRALILAHIKINIAQWWGWDKQHQLNLMPSSWNDIVAVLSSAERQLESIEMQHLRQSSAIEKFMFWNNTKRYDLLHKNSDLIAHSYIDLNFSSQVTILFKSLC